MFLPTRSWPWGSVGPSPVVYIGMRPPEKCHADVRMSQSDGKHNKNDPIPILLGTVHCATYPQTRHIRLKRAAFEIPIGEIRRNRSRCASTFFSVMRLGTHGPYIPCRWGDISPALVILTMSHPFGFEPEWGGPMSGVRIKFECSSHVQWVGERRVSSGRPIYHKLITALKSSGNTNPQISPHPNVLEPEMIIGVFN